eukprot:6359384-Pyramimonas_sp.AAC.1
MYVTSLCTSHLLLNALTWHRLHVKQLATLAHNYLSPFRLAAGPGYDSTSGKAAADHRVYVTCERMPIELVLRLRRLRFLPRLLKSALACMLAILDELASVPES